MARGKIKRQVGTIEHRSGTIIELMFDPNPDRLTFSAKVGSMVFTDSSADAVKRAVHKFLDDNAKLNWVPVIEVRETAPFASRNEMAFVGFDLERYYLANTTDPRNIRKLGWQNYEGESFGEPVTEMTRIRHATEFHGWHADVATALPRTDDHRGASRIHYLPYDEATWAGLEAVQNAIGRLKEQLRDLLRSDDGRKKLAQVGASLLRLLPETSNE
jgi:hypothetical protein